MKRVDLSHAAFPPILVALPVEEDSSSICSPHFTSFRSSSGSISAIHRNFSVKWIVSKESAVAALSRFVGNTGTAISNTGLFEDANWWPIGLSEDKTAIELGYAAGAPITFVAGVTVTNLLATDLVVGSPELGTPKLVESAAIEPLSLLKLLKLWGEEDKRLNDPDFDRDLSELNAAQLKLRKSR
jgi:hypothetical protein